MTKKIAGLIFLFITTLHVQAQTWVWKGGSSSNGGTGVYGTIGVGSVNNVPSARGNGYSFMKSDGSFWVFGGGGFNNDLWKYDTLTSEWTWVSGDNSASQKAVYGTKGVESSSNKPGARNNMGGWIDSNGDLWIFGGNGYVETSSGSRDLDDLWKYNFATKKWVWVFGNGSTTTPVFPATKGVEGATFNPGARQGVTTWTDKDGYLWLYGGLGYRTSSVSSLSYFTDVWRFNPTTKMWAMMSGVSTGNSVGVYGTLGVSSTENYPAGRAYARGCVDESGKFWLFGGEINNNSNLTRNDLWMFDPVTLEWTWMAGAKTNNAAEVLGTLGVEGPTVTPRAMRYAGAMWADKNNNILLFGGQGLSSGGSVLLRATFSFNPTTKMWKLIHHPSSSNVSYGTKNVPASTNAPGGRGLSMFAIDANKSLWLFGGMDNLYNYKRDVWNFSYPSTTITSTNTSAENADKILVYPNPANDVISISESANWDSIELINTQGVVVARFSNQNKLDISSISNGVYQLLLKKDNMVIDNKSIIIEK